jgi:RHS repeat-associated protein
VLSQASNAVTGISAALASSIAARQPLRYAGYVYDAHSATYYLSARHYDPATARFLSKDPARDDGDESAYQYCAGDPVGRVDPSGEWAERYTCAARGPNSFRVKMGWPFLSKGYCLAFAADLVFKLGTRGQYKKMGVQRIAVESYAHAVAHYAGKAAVATRIMRKLGAELRNRGSEAHVNNNERRVMVRRFYTVWGLGPNI